MMLVIGALLGFISVAFGAYAEHGLREILTQDQFRHILTAIRYNEIYAVLITALGLVISMDSQITSSRLIHWSAFLFVVGVTLFSFSIYIAYLFQLPSLLSLAPVGGSALMLAWLVLLGFALRCFSVCSGGD